jgi:nucleotide-binding universal stress UspA family protein
MNNFGDVIVGYDGSKGAKRAVEFAAAEADAHGARLRIVSVWNRTVPAVAALSPGAVPTVAADRALLVAERLEEATALARELAPDLEVETVAVEGSSAAAELIRASENGRLLVVGCRGHGGVHGLLLGSVSHQCALRAHCPVLVVPAFVDDRPRPHSHTAAA